MAKNILDDRHYMRLPICGYCMNAWDIIYQRPPWVSRAGAYGPEDWLSHCRVGGCDPDIWDFIEMKKPKVDDRVFHRRGSDADNAPWRRNMPALMNKFTARRDRYFSQKVIDVRTGMTTRVVPDEALDFGEVYPEASNGYGTSAPAAIVPDDDLEW